MSVYNRASLPMLHDNCHQPSPSHKAMASFKYSNSMRSIKFLLCLSLPCVLFSLVPLLFQSSKPFPMEFHSSYIVEKSCMFLICNGLLVLIALNSGLISSSPPTTTPQSIEDDVVPIEKINRLEPEEPHYAVAAPIVVEKTEFIQQEENVLTVVEQENVLSDTHDEEEEEGNALVMIIDEDEDDENVVDDAEELNKKCEDFIKRMKATFSSNNLEARIAQDSYFDDQKFAVAVN